jgi:hypothetical protein
MTKTILVIVQLNNVTVHCDGESAMNPRSLRVLGTFVSYCSLAAYIQVSGLGHGKPKGRRKLSFIDGAT